MRKWSKIYWNDFKDFCRSCWSFFLVWGVLVVLMFIQHAELNNRAEIINNQQEMIRVLGDEQLELLEINTLMETDIDDLVEENQIFTSMFAEIENEPGGHEILKKLYGQYK